MKLILPPRLFPVSQDASTVPASSNLLHWLPFLWQRVVFPGRAEAVSAVRLVSLMALVVVAGLVTLPSLNFHLFEPDEGRYAQIPHEMLDASNWLVPTLQDKPYLDKPPLFYWLVMTAYSVFGVAAWVARLVPALAVISCVLVVYLLGRRAVGERSAFWGALLLSLAPGLASMGRILVLDGLLTLFVTVALLAAFEAVRGPKLAVGWWRVMSVALALGTLTKGPIAILLVAPPLLLYRWLSSPLPSPLRDSGPGVRGGPTTGEISPQEPDLGNRCREGRTPHPRPLSPEGRGGECKITWRAWAGMLGIIAAINLPWYIAISIRHPEFASYFLWKHNLQRFLTPFDHEEPIWYFLPVLILGLAPVAWMLPLLGRFLLAARPADALRRCPEMGYFLLAGLWCVGFFSLSGSKLPTYILPAFPPLCLALGTYITTSGWQHNRLFRGFLMGWGALLIGAHVFVLPRVAWHRSPMNHPAEARPYLQDRSTPVYCYPRHIDSVSFYLDRNDFQVYRSKQLAEMLQSMDKHKRSIVLFAHRNSKLILSHNVPPHFKVIYAGKLGLCDMAVIER